MKIETLLLVGIVGLLAYMVLLKRPAGGTSTNNPKGGASGATNKDQDLLGSILGIIEATAKTFSNLTETQPQTT